MVFPSEPQTLEEGKEDCLTLDILERAWWLFIGILLRILLAWLLCRFLRCEHPASLRCLCSAQQHLLYSVAENTLVFIVLIFFADLTV